MAFDGQRRRTTLFGGATPTRHASFLDDGVAAEPFFQADQVTVPVQILEHAGDPCTLSPTSGAQAFGQALTTGPGVETFYHEMHGGSVQQGGDPLRAGELPRVPRHRAPLDGRRQQARERRTAVSSG